MKALLTLDSRHAHMQPRPEVMGALSKETMRSRFLCDRFMTFFLTFRGRVEVARKLIGMD